MGNFLIRWILGALALMVIAYLVPGIHVGFWSALVAALVLGVINAFLRPILFVLTLPVTILTLGLFLLVLNAILFALAALLVPGFTIHGFWTAVVGALLYWIATWAINQVVPRDSAAASRRSSSAIWS